MNERTLCVVCQEANFPSLVTCFICGAVLNHGCKELPELYVSAKPKIRHRAQVFAGEGRFLLNSRRVDVNRNRD